MSHLALALIFGVAAACVYGTCIVLQHRTASEHGGGEASAQGLLRAMRDPLWVFAVLGDFIGFVLNAIALSIGEVVYVQPLVVLMLPVALLVHWYMGGSPPRRGDYLGCLAIIGGLALFIALVGEPRDARPLQREYLLLAVGAVLVVGWLMVLAVRNRRKPVRGAVFGAFAGACFGTVAVMIDTSSDLIARRDVDALVTTARGLIVLGSIIVLGVTGIVLTQLSFQVGALGATLPANLAADPVFAVFLGVVLLREHIPLSPGHAFAYVLCLGVVLAGAIQLAEPVVEPVPGHGHAAEPADVRAE